MGAGKPLTARQKRRIERAVARAEAETGLEICVYVGPIEGSAREHVEKLYADLGLGAEHPGVLVLVAPPERRFEILTPGTASQRIGDRDCRLAALAMVASSGVGDLAGGICEAVRLLAQSAGPGRATAGELPNLIVHG